MPENPVRYHEGGFPPKKIEWEKLIPFIGPANAALARYDGMLAAIPNAALLLSPLMTREAVLSSRIEGTQASITEVMEFEAGIRPEVHDKNLVADIHEVLNYRKAMARAVELLKELPLCQRVIKEAHSILMEGVRGQGKAPGLFRKIPNWIGPPGTPMERATYIPISSDKLPSAMHRWENFIHAEAPDKLVQLAMLHAEFEALHPFLDGNGRLGRMFVPLFLFSSELLRSPMFYISAYLEARRNMYYELLLAVSRDNEWTEWCVFFLQAMKSQAEENLQKTSAILELYEIEKANFIEWTHSQHAIRALDFIFIHPIFSAKSFTNDLSIPKSTSIRILKTLRDHKIFSILREAKGQQAAVYAYRELINISEGKDVF